jgi:hypothetical protein
MKDKNNTIKIRRFLKIAFDVIMILLTVVALTLIVLSKPQKKLPDPSINSILPFDSK